MDMPPCRTTADHDWAYGEQAMWCQQCFLRRPYTKRNQKPTMKPPVTPPVIVEDRFQRPDPKRVRFTPNQRAWRFAEKVPNCTYCGDLFTDENPPTLDHVIPVCLGGGGGKVVACGPCNNSRGFADFDEYLSASIKEAFDAMANNRPYRRPKFVSYGDGRYEITTESKKERKRRREESGREAVHAQGEGDAPDQARSG